MKCPEVKVLQSEAVEAGLKLCPTAAAKLETLAVKEGAEGAAAPAEGAAAPAAEGEKNSSSPLPSAEGKLSSAGPITWCLLSVHERAR